jgi:hypothetical protein
MIPLEFHQLPSPLDVRREAFGGSIATLSLREEGSSVGCVLAGSFKENPLFMHRLARRCAPSISGAPHSPTGPLLCRRDVAAALILGICG